MKRTANAVVLVADRTSQTAGAGAGTLLATVEEGVVAPCPLSFSFPEEGRRTRDVSAGFIRYIHPLLG